MMYTYMHVHVKYSVFFTPCIHTCTIHDEEANVRACISIGRGCAEGVLAPNI